MDFVARTSTALAVALVAGTTVLAHPGEATSAAPARLDAAVELTASTAPWTPARDTSDAAVADVARQLSHGYRMLQNVAVAADESTPLLDAIDDAFIDGTVVLRRIVTPVLNQLGFVGKQIYIGLNLVESLTASAVFNGTDMLRGEGVVQNLRDVATDVGYSALFVAIDEVSIGMTAEAIAINRPPLDRPARWDDADPPFKGRPLSVPDRDREPTASAIVDRPARSGVFSEWKATKAERAEKAAEARQARRDAREAKRADKAEKADKADRSEPAGASETGADA